MIRDLAGSFVVAGADPIPYAMSFNDVESWAAG